MAAVALNDCVALILCTLSKPTLSALRVAINTLLTDLDLELAELKAQLIRFDVLSVPIQAAKVAADAALNTAAEMAGLLPVGIVAGCADLGNFNLNISATLARATADANDTLDDLNRQLSFGDELTFLINQTTEIKAQFHQVLDIIAGCP